MADKEKYFIPIEGKLIEVEKEVYVDYYRMNRRERYLEERDKDNGVFSYDALDGDGRKGEELFPDPKIESVEALALSQELMRQLHKCIDMLPRAERELIYAIYFEGLSDVKYAERTRKSQSNISRRHKKILAKLKMLLNFMGSF